MVLNRSSTILVKTGALLTHLEIDNKILLLRASNSLRCLKGHEVFSVVTGGRPLSFSRLISGGSRSSPDLSGENAEGAKTPLLISRRKDQAGSLGTEEKTS